MRAILQSLCPPAKRLRGRHAQSAEKFVGLYSATQSLDSFPLARPRRHADSIVTLRIMPGGAPSGLRQNNAQETKHLAHA